MKNHFISRVELSFWNLTIRALSQSDFARTSVQKAYHLLNDSETAAFGILIAVSGVAGLVSGYLFYVLRMSLR